MSKQTRFWFFPLLFFFLTFGQARSEHLVVFTEISPPYQTLNGDNVSGLATDRVRELLDSAGLAAEFFAYPWARSYELAKSTPGALIYSIARTAERNQYFHWIAPVARFKLAFMSLASRNVTLGDRDALTRYSIAVQRNDIAHKWLVRQNLIENQHFLVCADIVCSWDLLLKGNVDLVIDDPLLAKPTLIDMGKDPKTVKVVSPIPALDVVGYLALTKGGDPEVLHKLQGAAISLAQPE